MMTWEEYKEAMNSHDLHIQTCLHTEEGVVSSNRN